MTGRREIKCRWCEYRPRKSGEGIGFIESTLAHIDANAVFANCCPRCGLRQAFVPLSYQSCPTEVKS